MRVDLTEAEIAEIRAGVQRGLDAAAEGYFQSAEGYQADVLRRRANRKKVIKQQGKGDKGSLMYRLGIVLLITSCILFVLPVVALPMLPDAKSEIQSALRRSDDSMHRKDIVGCMRSFTPDFQGEDIKGSHYDRMQAKQNLLKSFSSAHSIKAKTTLKSLSFVHDDAIVLGQEHTKLTIFGKRTHRPHTLVFEGLWQSIIVKTKKGWQIKREKQLTSTMTIDGVVKVVEPDKSK